MLQKVDYLPIDAVGKQPSIILINLGRKWTLADDDETSGFDRLLILGWLSK